MTRILRIKHGFFNFLSVKISVISVLNFYYYVSTKQVQYQYEPQEHKFTRKIMKIYCFLLLELNKSTKPT